MKKENKMGFVSIGTMAIANFKSYAHEEILQCYFDVQCRRQNCRFFHTKYNQSGHMPRFLYNRSLQRQYQDQKRHMEEGQRAQGYRR